jgi:single-strand DNA-binding protein
MLICRLGGDPEKRVTQSGTSVANVSAATSEKYKDQSGSMQEKTEWHKLVFWNKTADLVEQYCHKGSLIYVEGSIQTKEWDDKEGKKQYTKEIVCRQLQFLDSKPKEQSQQSKQQNCEDLPAEDLPF